jgi:hypothetical protein
LLAIALAGVILQSSAESRTLKASHSQVTPPVHEALSVSVPQSDIVVTTSAKDRSALSSASSSASLSAIAADDAYSPLLGGVPHLAFSASSWNPTDLNLSSQIGDATSFERMKSPALGLEFIAAPFARYRHASFSLLGGVGFSRLYRTGSYSSLNVTQAVQQKLYLLPVVLGVESSLELSRTWRIFAKTAVCPTGGATERSVFDDGRTVYGVPLEFAAGVGLDLRWMMSALRGTELKADVLQSVGTVGSGDFSGRGLRAGVSFPM